MAVVGARARCVDCALSVAFHMRGIRVGIIGDFDREKRSHWATETALFHAAARLGVRVEPTWIATSSVRARGVYRAWQSSTDCGVRRGVRT